MFSILPFLSCALFSLSHSGQLFAFSNTFFPHIRSPVVYLSAFLSASLWPKEFLHSPLAGSAEPLSRSPANGRSALKTNKSPLLLASLLPRSPGIENGRANANTLKPNLNDLRCEKARIHYLTARFDEAKNEYQMSAMRQTRSGRRKRNAEKGAPGFSFSPEKKESNGDPRTTRKSYSKRESIYICWARVLAAAGATTAACGLCGISFLHRYSDSIYPSDGHRQQTTLMTIHLVRRAR